MRAVNINKVKIFLHAFCDKLGKLSIAKSFVQLELDCLACFVYC